MTDDTEHRMRFTELFLRIVDEDAFSDTELQHRQLEFVFYMMDCLEDLEPFAECMANLPNRDVEESRRILYVFFIHALNHLEAARSAVMPEYKSPFQAIK